MFTFILVAHIVIALVLVVVVLLQQGKGGGLGAGFGGGGANTLFGSSGGSNFFTKLTMCLAAAFMLTSLGLTVIRSKSLRTSIFDQGAASTGAPQVAPGSAAPTPATATATEAADKAISPGAAPIAAPKK
ncbi:MAG: preprotein translocase subunit SecG [Bacteriovoracia bacterium]